MKTLLLLSCFVLNQAQEEGTKEVKIQGFDVLTTPGKAIQLQAKLEKKGLLGIHPNIHHRELIFKLGDKEIGRAETKDEGIATVSWTTPKEVKPNEQEFEFTVQVAPNKEYKSMSCVLRVFVRDPKHPALVIDLDGTICASKEIEVGLKDPEELRCAEGSVEAVQSLAKNYDIIYLTARDDSFIHRSRSWLDLNKYPHGPVLVRDLNLFKLSAEKYKTARLIEMKKEFNLVAGVGDRDEDANAYMAAGMKAYLVGKATKVPIGARKLDHWSEVEKLLKE